MGHGCKKCENGRIAHDITSTKLNLSDACFSRVLLSIYSELEGDIAVLKLTDDEYARYMTLIGANPNAVEHIAANHLNKDSVENNQHEA